MKIRSRIFFLGMLLLFIGQTSLLAHYEDIPGGILPLAAGMVLTAIALWKSPYPDDAPVPSGTPPASVRLPGASLGLVTLSVLIMAVVAVRANARPFVPRYLEYFGLWALGAAWFVEAAFHADYGLSPRALVRFIRGRLEGHVRREWRTLAALGVLTLAAFIVRVAVLDDIPRPFAWDEAIFANEAAAIADGDYPGNPFAPAAIRQIRIYLDLMAIGIAIAGRTIAGARLASVFLGTIAVPAVFFLGRELFGRRVGLLAALFLVGFHYHLHFSRVALNNSSDFAFSALAFALLTRGLRSGRLWHFASAGVLFGFSQYFYTGTRLVPITAAAWIGIAWLLGNHVLRDNWKQVLLRLGMLAAGFILVEIPAVWHSLLAEGSLLGGHFADKGYFASGRFEVVAAEKGSIGALWDQVKWSWLALVHTHDQGAFYGGSVPLLGLFAGIPFLLGAAGLAGKLRRVEPWLPIVWVAVTMTGGGALLISPPHFQRFSVMMPAVALLVALGIDRFSTSLPLPRRLTHLVIPLVLAVLLMAGDIAYYFAIYPAEPNGYAKGAHDILGEAVGLDLAEHFADAPDIRVYYMTSPHIWFDNSVLVGYFAPGLNDTEIDINTIGLPETVDPQAHNLFIFTPERVHQWEVVANMLPDGTFERHDDLNGDPLYYTYEVAPQH